MKINWKSINKTWGNTAIVAVTLFAGYHALCACGVSQKGLREVTATSLYVLPPYWQKQQIAAEQGDVKAQVNLGEMYDRGELGKPDYAAAAKWWRRAAEQGNAEAQSQMAPTISMAKA
jgi:Sel1 repeat